MLMVLHLKSSAWKTVTVLCTTGWGEVSPPCARAKGCTTSSSSSNVTSCRKGLAAACFLEKIKGLGKQVVEKREERDWGVKWRSNSVGCRHKRELRVAAGRGRKEQLRRREEEVGRRASWGTVELQEQGRGYSWVWAKDGTLTGLRTV